MEVMWILGFVALILVIYLDREVLRVDFEAVGKFVVFMATFKLVILVVQKLVLGSLPPVPPLAPLYYLPMVWWEDLLFSLIPIYYARKYLPLYLANTAAILGSLIFAYFHLYQGPLGLIAVIYPFFISYRYGKEFGYGTVMFCHVIYDCMVVFGFLFSESLK
jgi:hypothetical protein